jgi:hypothetical protein
MRGAARSRRAYKSCRVVEDQPFAHGLAEDLLEQGEVTVDWLFAQVAPFAVTPRRRRARRASASRSQYLRVDGSATTLHLAHEHGERRRRPALGTTLFVPTVRSTHRGLPSGWPRPCTCKKTPPHGRVLHLAPTGFEPLYRGPGRSRWLPRSPALQGVSHLWDGSGLGQSPAISGCL